MRRRMAARREATVIGRAAGASDMDVLYAVVVGVVWLVFFALWFLLGIPLGPGSPVHTG
jgi:p-aminobenzoyl-glutamate transporter AbgT